VIVNVMQTQAFD